MNTIIVEDALKLPCKQIKTELKQNESRNTASQPTEYRHRTAHIVCVQWVG